MIKKILLSGAALVLISVVAALFFASAALDKAVVKGVETFGPKITLTDVTLESASISPLSGNGKLKGLFVGNPEGFKLDKVFFLGEIEVDMDPFSLMGDHIVINRIYVRQPEVVYEQTLKGNNLKRLMSNIEENTGTTGEDGEESKPIKFEIKELVIEEGSVTMGLVGQGMKLPLPTISLTDIGTEKGGVTPSEAVKEIMGAVIGSSMQTVTQSAGKVLEGGVDAAGNVGKKATEAVGGLGGMFKKK